jgi:hypothetical protein
MSGTIVLVIVTNRERTNAMEDLKQYSDSELSLRVFNDEGLYRMRHRRGFIDSLRDIFSFSSAQQLELEQDLRDDLDEEQSA